MKILPLVLAFLTTQVPTSGSIELTPAQQNARSQALFSKNLSGIKKVAIDIVCQDEKVDFKVDKTALSDAVELELRRSGINVVKDDPDARLELNVTLLRTYAGETINGYCGYESIKVSTLGFTDKWTKCSILELYLGGSVFTASAQNQEQVNATAGDQTRAFCLAWLRDNAKQSLPGKG